jgi:hypothetical protein
MTKIDVVFRRCEAATVKAITLLLQCVQARVKTITELYHYAEAQATKTATYAACLIRLVSELIYNGCTVISGVMVIVFAVVMPIHFQWQNELNGWRHVIPLSVMVFAAVGIAKGIAGIAGGLTAFVRLRTSRATTVAAIAAEDDAEYLASG